MSNAMNITIPVPQVTSGPQYAEQVSDALDVIAEHTHTGSSNGDGNQIPSAGLDINEDLSIQNNNLISLRSARFTDQPSTLAGIGDVGCLYEKDGDLYFNNEEGIPVQITSGNSINFQGNVNYGVLSVSNNYTIDYLDTFTVLECDSTSSTILITLPSITDIPAGRLYIIKDFNGTSESNFIRVNPAGTDTIDDSLFYTIQDNYSAISVISDGVGNWSLYEYNRKIYFSGEVVKLTTGAELIVESDANINSLYAATADISGNLFVGGDITLNNNLAVLGTATVEDLEVINKISGQSGGTLAVNSSITSPSYLITDAITGLIRISQAGGNALEGSWYSNNDNIWKNDALGLNLNYNLNLPQGIVITEISVRFKGKTGHADLPASMPSILFRRRNASSGLDLTIGSQTDTSINTSSYEIIHNITISGLNHTINNTDNAYYLRVTAESGANAELDAEVHYYKITYSIPAGYDWRPS